MNEFYIDLPTLISSCCVYANDFQTKWMISIKFSIDILPLEITPPFYLLTPCHQSYQHEDHVNFS
jgi:hypothetical protein